MVSSLAVIPNKIMEYAFNVNYTSNSEIVHSLNMCSCLSAFYRKKDGLRQWRGFLYLFRDVTYVNHFHK